MSTRSQRYIINPRSACPSQLRTSAGRPLQRVPLDMDDVARCAWNEILQTAPSATSLFAFLEDLLQPGPHLVWKGQGPGRGTEMRRSFSGLLGRFFARAYLQVHHDFVWFAAIDGDNFHLSPNWRVSRKPGSKTQMPDWICAGPGVLAIGEAKGSHQKGNVTRGGIPGPIKTAQGQITGVRVQKRVRHRLRSTWQSKRLKGWAIMSRWGLASPPRDPFLYVLDPETEGEFLTPDESEELVQVVARSHIAQTALGLGLLQEAEDQMTRTPRRRVRVVNDQLKRSFSGAVITPFGALDVDLDRAKALGALLPDPSLVRYVGLDEGLLNDFMQNEPLVPRALERIGEETLIGRDGFLVAPVGEIIGLGLLTDQQS